MRSILLWGIGLLAGCAEAPLPPGEQVPSGAPTSAADPEMCAEHGLLQAVCTRCNPALVAVFQAKGDWCAEHEFPASFCPICRPEQGGRPLVADVTADGSPPDGIRVRFRTREAASLAGIETAEAVGASWVGGVEAVARLAWDASQVALVSAPAPGVVTAIRADVGSPVARGDALAVVRSAHVGGDRSRVVAARRAQEVAALDLEREQRLRASGVASEREVLAAEQALASARAEVGALEAELGLVGGGAGDAFTLTSPIAGVVTERHAAVGLSVGADEPLFQVVDASRMWAGLDVAEADLARVVPGLPAEIRLDALPDRVFRGEVAYLSPAIDPHTRTAQARVVLDNADGALRANMYGTALLVTEAAEAVVTVPSSAVQRAGEVSLVFVREAEDSFVGRRVEVLARAGDRVRISGPVRPGDPVATTGSFLLKTETLKDSIGAGCCDVE